MRVRIDVSLKKDILDPQGTTIEHTLKSLGFENVRQVRVHRHITYHSSQSTQEGVQEEAKKMCETLLVNPVMETYTVTVTES